MEPAHSQTIVDALLAWRDSSVCGVGLSFTREQATGWNFMSWQEFAKEVFARAKALATLGLESGEAIGILMPPSLEWELSHYSALAIGGVVVGIDSHDTDQKLNFIIQHAQVRFLFVRDLAEVTRLDMGSLQTVRLVVCFNRGQCNLALPVSVYYWKDLKGGSDLNLALPQPTDPATIIYTSGTTSNPRAIRYSHQQMALACDAVSRLWPGLNHSTRTVCWLPLSNLFQRMVNMIALRKGAEIWFIEDPGQIIGALPEISPSVFVAVPRFYEKLVSGLRARLATLPLPARIATRIALAISYYRQICIRQEGSVSGVVTLMHRFFDRLVLRRIRSCMGSRIEYLISGSAPIPLSTLEFLESIGLPVYEAYGLSENIVPVTMNYPGNQRLGSVGPVVIKDSVKLSNSNEVLIKGPGLFSGYYNEQTSVAGAFTQDGFYCTGDYGYFEDDFLFLSGRASDFIKTSTGRRISPLPIETHIKNLNYVDHAFVCGDGRKCLAALITVDRNQLPLSANGNEKTALQMAHLSAQIKGLIGHDLRQNIKTLGKHEQPKGIIVLFSGFSIRGGELTSSLKLRRQAIVKKYQAVFDQLYKRLEETSANQLHISFLTKPDLPMADFLELNAFD